jgi:superoxide reductase
MAKLREVYKCAVCGNIVEVLHAGEGTLVCCGQPMDIAPEKKEDVGAEKHVPVIETTAGGLLIKVGSVPHPMEAAHYIEWIEAQTENGSYKKFLKPGDKPEFLLKGEVKVIKARCYCNIHGLWQS